MLAVSMYFYPSDAVYQQMCQHAHTLLQSLRSWPVFKADLIAVYLFGCVFNLPL